jgi:hypothetical protein
MLRRGGEVPRPPAGSRGSSAAWSCDARPAVGPDDAVFARNLVDPGAAIGSVEALEVGTSCGGFVAGPRSNPFAGGKDAMTASRVVRVVRAALAIASAPPYNAR